MSKCCQVLGRCTAHVDYVCMFVGWKVTVSLFFGWVVLVVCNPAHVQGIDPHLFKKRV